MTPQARKDAAKKVRDGDKAAAANDWEKAEKEYLAALERNPLEAPALFGLGRVQMATKRYAEALETYTKLKAAHAQAVSLAERDQAESQARIETDLNDLRGQLARLQGLPDGNTRDGERVKLEESIRELERQKSRGGELDAEVPAEVSLATGSAHFRLGHSKEAEAEFRDAIRKNAKLGEAHNNLAVLLMLDGRYEEAEKELTAAASSGFAVNPKLREELEHRKAQAK